MEDATRICRIVPENDKNKDYATCKMKWADSCIMMSRSCSACGKDGIGMTTRAGGLIRNCAVRQDVKRWSTFVVTRCTQGVSRENCSRETGKATIKTGWAETDTGQPGKPNVRARWVAKEYKTHARPELHAPTPPLEALKVVLSEIATARRAYFYAPARRRAFVELLPVDYQAGDEHMCGLLRYSLYGTRDAAQNWEEELATALRSLTQIEHEWDNANNSDHRDRPQMADDDDDSQAFTNGDITRYRALVARISYLSQDRPDLKFASMQVYCAMVKPTMRDMERVKRIGRYFVGKPRARCWFRWQQSGEQEVYSDAVVRRQSHSKIRIGWGHHERRTLPRGMDQEAASCGAVFS